MDHPFRDVDASYLPPFSDDIALLILARLPSSKYCDLRLVNRRFRSLIRSGELNEIRKKIGLKVPKIFLHSGEARYQCYEPYTRSCWDLPVCPYDETTPYRARELFCLGTHLLLLGIINGDCGLCGLQSDSDIWRYELELNRWFNSPMMITPRFVFASADCGSVACVAGGEQQGSEEVLNSAEKYNPESKSWESLPSMNRRRCFCSGLYMDSKFYVIGGINENRDLLTCGECYDFERNVWELIPNMIEDDPSRTVLSSQPQDFVAVVNNELYYLDVPSRHLKVYLKNNSTWKIVGRAPASIELFEGWGVKLKSLGDELVLICRTLRKHPTLDILMCFCTPSPELDNVEWRVLEFDRQGRNLFIHNCCVMMA
ncbi:F-box/kelch-repeat protein At3g27150-like [Ananas comosus]|uniref:F-box/kelch-repeat protein At3g27150-like n=1 Tax=Ananas comosus TaxID=4615 RepID=A0A6P5EJ60_ANACO|nr:F-box/kelch-repeat protein At3g27150-like [Ananas comosus]XP_020081458.1 F-box/kelch-repeat protein At3g27150-like [Ananas comosus]XP_020081459.1 F-box/kelch-repeat protein At3g27150-like [Ananas comosus]XP_020081460.1 F-box/kelch-repeat protein At3g27150-like [Ananas comosus]XP_020081461.1 F-box/kelch-repeat protein At3g27150-like [Ananas comosus]XP_020081463.1 F-box/kelch-repeat protein At3g27150-like [Ananas comosus]